MRRNREKARIGARRVEATRTLLTIGEASRLLHVHQNTLRRWSNQGLVKTYRIGPALHRRFKREDLAVFLVEEPQRLRADTSRLQKFPKRAKRAS